MFRENKFLLFGGRYFSLAFLARESEDPSQGLWLFNLICRGKGGDIGGRRTKK
jgi:hypothetical protein